MGKSKYVDTSAIIQVIGCIYKNCSLLEDKKYFFNEDDFPQDFHKILFGSIYNLYHLGVKAININTIEDYLIQRPQQYGIYQVNKGAEYLADISEKCSLATFDYYYSRMKKMTLFRAYESIGFDLKWLYDADNIFDTKKKQRQEEWLDNTPIENIADLIDKKIFDIRLKAVENATSESTQAGEGALQLIEDLRKTPEVGYPLYGPMINGIVRGARLKKFYLRSASTGTGKTRAMIADACNFACNEIYVNGKWQLNGTKEPTIYITTEQEVSEIQTAMIAFLSEVEEDHILTGEYAADEYERVVHAVQILNESPLRISTLPDFSLQDIENTIKRGVSDFDVKFVCFDYIHSSMKILTEITSKAGVKGLREDNVLFMIGTRLKDLCNKYGIFIISSTQLNGKKK